MYAAGEHLRHVSQHLRAAPAGAPGVPADASRDRRRLGDDRAPDGGGAGRAGRLPGGAGRGQRSAGCARRRGRCRPSSGSWATGSRKPRPGWFADFVAAADVPPALRDDLDRRDRERGRGGRGAARLAARRVPARPAGTPDARRAASATGASPAAGTAPTWTWPRRTTGAGRSTGEIMAADERRGGQGAAGRDPAGGDAPSRRARARSSTASSEVRDWLQDLMDTAMDAAGRHALRPGRSGPGSRRMIAPAGSAAAPYYTGAVAGLLPARPDLAADPGPDHVPGLGPGQHLVPRGRARPPPAARAVGLRRRPAVDVPDDRRRRERQHRGLGAVRRAADGRARLPRDRRAPGSATWTRS